MIGFFSPFIYLPISQGTKEFLQTFSFSKNNFQQIGVKNNSTELNSQISKNQAIASKSKISCTPKNNDAKLYVNPLITSDTLDQVIGLSWSFVYHSTEKTNGGSFYKGHLVSPRGGHQPEVVYIDPFFWVCSE